MAEQDTSQGLGKRQLAQGFPSLPPTLLPRPTPLRQIYGDGVLDSPLISHISGVRAHGKVFRTLVRRRVDNTLLREFFDLVAELSHGSRRTEVPVKRCLLEGRMRCRSPSSLEKSGSRSIVPRQEQESWENDLRKSCRIRIMSGVLNAVVRLGSCHSRPIPQASGGDKVSGHRGDLGSFFVHYMRLFHRCSYRFGVSSEGVTDLLGWRHYHGNLSSVFPTAPSPSPVPP